jgi:metallo-beta-lactamase family protein
MKLVFVGADHEVTGSCHYLEVAGKHILVDYGMEQGVNVFENVPLPVAESMIDYVFLTHAHVDHSGLLPLLYARGFRGQIYSTDATADLCSIMLRDCAHIQSAEAEWKNRKAKRSANNAVVEPLYTMEDADGVIRRFVPCHYNTIVEVCEGVKIRFTDIGHLLGSASIEVWLTEDGNTKKIVFSGDIGNKHQPLLKDPTPTKEADYVVMESTYGDRLHPKDKLDYVAELTKVLQETLDRGGNVVIPSFAVGRTQEILYFLRKIKVGRLVKGHEDFPVYVDSPMAVEATGVFQENRWECFDDEAMEFVKEGINPIAFSGLKLSITSEESKAINFDETPKVIISASGMCDAGRIRHHLKHNLWRPECTILFVGYQSVGTLGRALVEGADEVKLFGETVSVRAEIRKMTGLSGHADKEVIRETRLGVNVFLAYLAERNGDRKKAEEHVRTAVMALEDMTQVSSEYDSIQNLLQYVEKIGKTEQIEEVLNCLEPKAAIEQNKSLLLQLLSLRMRYCSSRMTPEEFKQSADTFFHLKDSWELTENSQVMYMMELRKRLQAAEEEQKEQERKRNRLLYQADHDELTGLYNKRSLNRYLEDVFEDCLLNEKELGILFLDIDHFKQLNDRYGHGRGDEGICAVADTLKKCFPEDYVARYGGDEFLVVMTGRDREYAEEHARQLCMGIRECEIPNEDSSVEPWLTISVGGVCAIPKEPNRVWDFLSAADKTLYDQKNEQKGKVRFYVGEGQYL